MMRGDKMKILFSNIRTHNKLLLLTGVLCISLLFFVGAVYGGSPISTVEQAEGNSLGKSAFAMSDLTLSYNQVLSAETVAVQVETELTPSLTTIRGEVILHSPTGKQTVVFDNPAVKTGSRITTGPDGEAKLTWPDGSSIMIEPDTELLIKETKGMFAVSESFSGNNSKDVSDIELYFVSLVLEQGKIFGSLVPKDQDVKELLVDSDQKVRMEVEMPWGVAGIRGTIWMNALEEDREVTSVLSGSVEVSSAGVSVLVKPGQLVSVDAETAKPGEPVDMDMDELDKWRNARSWVGDVKSSEANPSSAVFDRLENLPEKNNGSVNQGESAPGSSEEAPGQTGSAPGLSGDTPGQSGNVPGKGATAPGQSGSTPGLSGNTPGQSGSAPGQSGSAPGNSGSAPGNSGGSSSSSSSSSDGDSSPGKSGSAPGKN